MPKSISESLIQLCDLLSDGAWHDGTSLGKALSLSRSGVWKVIKKLQSYQVPLNIKHGKGYQLHEPLILLNPKAIRARVSSPCDVAVYESVASTNVHLLNEGSIARWRACLAEQQTAGKGRLGRQWYSPFGKNIYLSCSYHFNKDISELAGLSLVVSLAILAALKAHGIHHGLSTKWPNDVLYEGKKIAGTLIDIRAESNGLTQAIVGVGLNVNLTQSAITGEIDQAWTSVCEITGNKTDRNTLAALLIDKLFHYLRRFNDQGFVHLREEWLQTSHYLGKMITYSNAGCVITGRVVDVNAQGHLVIEQEGKQHICSAGDTSLIK